MRREFAQTLVKIAEHDSRVVLLTADLGFGVLDTFAERFPERFYNVGVAEANMIGIATGLAEAGFIPFAYSIATFATLRPYEQIRNGPILHRLPVRVVGVGGGFEYAANGMTHYAVEDYGLMRLQPSVKIILPATSEQACVVLRDTYQLPGPIYYRISKKESADLPGLEGRFRLGRIETLLEGDDVLILAAGCIAVEAMKAAELLLEWGIRATIGIVSSLRPEPIPDLTSFVERFAHVVTLESHYITGGLGSLVAEVIAECRTTCRLTRLGVTSLPDGVSGSEAYMNQRYGLSAQAVARQIRDVAAALNQ